jgi:beta-N-acetylglucosaminidase
VQISGRRRTLLVGLVAAGLAAIALPVKADSTPSVGAAQRNLAQAQHAAQQASTALGAAQQQLAGAQQQLAAIQARLVVLDQTVTADTAQVAQLTNEVNNDKAQLAAYVRSIYKSGGSSGALAYIIAASNLGDAFQRVAEMDSVDRAGKVLLARIGGAELAAHQALDAATAARAQARVAGEQAATAEAVVAVETSQYRAATIAADSNVTTARHQLTAAQAAAAARARAAAAAAAAAAGSGVVYQPVPGPAFTVDTDLTLPSGETAAKLNTFLGGSALAGLGGSFMTAETTYHVSARYFVAHAILESAWGTSAIAQNKHNLFGYGADDRNPYGDAMTFSSFDACIQFVAQKVDENYLSPSGPFYHGPTLRGMNVDYASDPNWAAKIAAIASTIPD